MHAEILVVHHLKLKNEPVYFIIYATLYAQNAFVVVSNNFESTKLECCADKNVAQ